MANPAIVTPGAALLTKEQVKDQCRISSGFTADDGYITNILLPSVQQEIETFLRRSITNTILEYHRDDFPYADHITLPGGRLVSIDNLTYTDSDGDATVWPAANYFAATAREPGALVLVYNGAWPVVTLRPREAVSITYTCGQSANDKPYAAARQAMLLASAFYYAHRGDLLAHPGQKTWLPEAAQRLLWPHRILV